MIKKIIIITILLLHGLSYSQFNVNPRLYNDENGWFTITLPEGFKRIVGTDYNVLIKKHQFLFNRKIDAYNKIHIFSNNERLLIIKTYKEAVPLRRSNIHETIQKFEMDFNDKMKKQNQPYIINYEDFKIEEKNSNTFFILYGKGNLYISKSAFIQAVINLAERRSIIIYGFLNLSEKKLLNSIFLKSILSIEPKTPAETDEVQSSSNPLQKKWFRYLILLGVAIAVTLLYNKYAKQKQAIPLNKKKDDGNS